LFAGTVADWLPHANTGSFFSSDLLGAAMVRECTAW